MIQAYCINVNQTNQIRQHTHIHTLCTQGAKDRLHPNAFELEHTVIKNLKQDLFGKQIVYTINFAPTSKIL
jgi:hypothetical protein